ncbi:MAG: TrmH family RNA methyltransferase [Candidatus Ornithomonoglobus sp.]
MIDIISTTKNKTYKYIKSLQQKKVRAQERRFTVEGIKSVRDAAASCMGISMTAVSESFYNNEDFDYPSGARLFVVKDGLFTGLCDTKTPQGIIAVIDMPSHEKFSAAAGKPYIYCDNISDPGNLGTIIRTADAAGFGAVLLSPGCVDLYSPKTVRSSMGSFFNINVVPGFEIQRLFDMKKQGFELYCGALRDDSMLYTSVDFKKPSVIIVGNEANGVCDEILSECKHIIIPILGSAESLNAAVAAAVMMYELVRQRSI